ncbi:MAG: hypothetical protein MMC33_002036 [Icmadophila ericetorum]|nr:hypothetical protein [Icmadophila ericetorum]
MKVLNDVTYVAQYWNLTTFDLWEEVSGSSFFTTANQHRALAQATQVATALNTSCTACESQAPEILCFLNSAYWNGNYIDANINITANRSGLDSNTVLASISVFDINAPCSSETFQPCSSYSLANFKALTDSFRPIYAINSAAIGVGSAVAVGRYPEDIYYGGNPWYLATLACAEFLYDAVAQWNTQKSLTVDSTSISFFQDLDSSVKAGTYASSSSEFTTLTTAATSYADAFVSVVETYVPTNGSLSEQFNRTTGYPLSAYDLTWSFASFVTMSQRRAGTFPLSWGAANIQSAPSKCIGGGVEGTYTVAQAAESGQASSTATGTSGGSASGTGTGPASATTTKSGAVATFALDYLYLLVLGVFAAVLSF